jgi:nucleotide-binding universal stress UspA family protein
LVVAFSQLWQKGKIMVEFHRILFPVDLSDASKATAPFVRAMAEHFQSEIIALHALRMPASMYAVPDASGLDVLAQLDAIRQERQAEFESFLAEAFPDLAVRRELIEGDPASVIVSYARENRVDLIMMPTHGHGRMRQFLLGSVTAKVLHDSCIPVWTEGHATEPGSHPAGCYGHILCAVDADTNDIPVIQWAAEFARKEHADLRLIHAVEGAKSKSAESDSPVRQELFELAHHGMEKLQKSAATAFEVTLRGGTPENVIQDAVQDLEADLIVIGRGGIRGALGRLRSHAASILRQSPCPVISV